MSKLRVAIAGATGYAGEELIRLLLRHPQVQLTCLAASEKWSRPVPLSEVFPRFAGQLDLSVEALSQSSLDDSDIVFLALPHGAGIKMAGHLLQKMGKRVIDLSGDFRLKDPTDYPRWYDFEHSHPELLGEPAVVYGLTEFHREAIRSARLIANPGCYATSILLALLPLFKRKLIEGKRLIVDAKSGLSGAGRKAEAALLFTEMTENLRAYKVNRHPHMPEVLQEIERTSGESAQMVFVPQVIPASRGLISNVYVKSAGNLDALREAYQASYARPISPFVRVRFGSLPQLRDVIGTNFCDVGLVLDSSSGTLIIGSALDNLTKGAAGQAIQNLNVMCGWPETTGLL